MMVAKPISQKPGSTSHSAKRQATNQGVGSLAFCGVRAPHPCSAWRTRNILLPYYIYVLADEPMKELAEVSGFVQFFLCYLLSILALLNYYWLGMFILVARNKMRRGELVDEHDNISNSMKKKA